MRFIRSIPMVAVALTFGAVSFAARPAQAAPCCSAPMCQQLEPPSWCNICRDCTAEEAAAEISEEPVYDEVAAVCRAATDVAPTFPAEGEADEAGLDAGCR